MKKFFSMLLVLLCVLLLSAPAMAESTTLQTVVPSQHSITINCGINGSVIANGQRYTGTVTLTVPRLGELSVTACPNSGYGISQLGVADMSGVTISSQTIRLTGIHGDNTVTVGFYQLLPYNPGNGYYPGVKTGDDAPSGLYLSLLLSSAAVLAIAGMRLKRKYN